MATMQTSLPMGLFDQLQHLRRRYAAALKAAAAGDYSREQQLRACSRAVGHLLAAEARKSPAERGGLRLLDISLAVDGFFPELRGFNQHELIQAGKKRMAESLGLPAPAPAQAPARRNRAS